MSSYTFRAARQDGAIVTGALEADGPGHVSATLASRGLFPIAVTEKDSPPRRAASRSDLAIVFRSISALVAAGVPLERAVASTVTLSSGPLRDTLLLARGRLHEGASLAQALSGSRGAIPAVVLGMVRAGEQGSQLAPALEQVATHLEQEADLLAHVRQALMYPLLLGLAGVASVGVITLVVIPRFAAILNDVGQQLPTSTRLLLAASSFAMRFWIPLLASAAGGIWACAEWLRRPAGLRRCQEILLQTPIIGAVRRSLATARVTRALGGMLRAGMPLLPALDAAREAAGDLAIADRLARSRERVAQGSSLTAALEREAPLMPNALQLLAVGESSGRMAEMALTAGNLAAQDAERGLRALVTVLEPALIVGFGGLVAFTAAALLQAVYSLRPV